MPEGTGGEQQEQQTQQGQQQKQDPPKTFTQEELDAHIEQRLARERTKFADYDALKTKAAAFDEAERAKQTELERAQSEAKAAKDSEQAAIARANATLKRASILAEAAAQKSADPEIVAMILANEESVTVEADGTVKGVKEAVKKVLKDKPHLVAAQGGSASGGEFGGEETQGLDTQIAEAERKGDFRTAMQLKMRRAGVGSPSV